MNSEYLKNFNSIKEQSEKTNISNSNQMDSQNKPSSRSGSPLRDLVGLGGTQGTEHQPPLSGSRQSIDSQFLKKVDEISIVHNGWTNLMTTYNSTKDSNQLLKQGFERSEDAAYWVRQKAVDIAKATKWDDSFKKIDSVAATSVVKLENTQTHLRNRFESANREVQSKIQYVRDTTYRVQKETEGARSTLFGAIQKSLDLIENTFESVMLKSSPESAKYSNDPEFMTTVGRMLDVTYRFNLGLLTITAQRARDLTNKKNWENFYATRVQPHTPSKVRIRQSIIYQEILKEMKQDDASEGSGSKLSYMENKELLEVDRKIINLGRQTASTAKYITQIPSKVWDNASRPLTYSKEAVGHLGEAKNLRDLAGIGLYEIRGVLVGAQDNIPVLGSSTLLEGIISWMASQEKVLRNTT